MSLPHQPFVSIIIPTFNRASLLPITVDSFLKQTYPADRYEIIIMDNNSSDATKVVVEKYTHNDRGIKVNYQFEPRQGVHYARNHAALVARGDILYFTDDDMIADENLLSEVVAPFSINNKIGTVSGKIVPRWEQKPPQWILELCNNYLLSLNDRGDGVEISAEDSGIFSCHQAISREAFFKTGGFHPENTAGEWLGDGETGLNIDLKKNGYLFAYNGRSKIEHMIPAGRMTQKYLNKRFANQGNCDSYTFYHERKSGAARLFWQIIIHTLNIFKMVARFFLRLLYNSQKWRIEWAKVFYYISRIKYDWRLMSDREWRMLVSKEDWLN